MNEIIGTNVIVTIDRPLGSKHPNHSDIIYPVNYGYIEGVMAGDGEWQDAYILGIEEPIETFCGKVIAVIRRLNDVENKWIVVPENKMFSKNEIQKIVSFQEQYFETEIIM